MRLCVLILAALATFALAQQDKGGKDATSQTNDQKKASDDKGKQQKGGLFQNKLGYKGSQASKESTTLGFNGIDPSGKIDKDMMAKAPTSADQDKVKLMAQNRPQAADLKAFLQQGGLKEK
jgi:hypothetical protein